MIFTQHFHDFHPVICERESNPRRIGSVAYCADFLRENFLVAVAKEKLPQREFFHWRLSLFSHHARHNTRQNFLRRREHVGRVFYVENFFARRKKLG